MQLLLRRRLMMKPSISHIPTNEIHYTTSDGSLINLNIYDEEEQFGTYIMDNIINDDGVGIISFDGDVTRIGYNAFIGNEYVKTLHFPKTVSYIDSFIIESVETVYFDGFLIDAQPDSVAFANTGLQTIYVNSTPYKKSNIYNSITIPSHNTDDIFDNTYVEFVLFSYDECVLSGTKILTSLNGDTKNVEDLVIGDNIITKYNDKIIVSEIDKIISVEHDRYVQIILEDEVELNISIDHAIFTDSGWKSYEPYLTEVPENVGKLTVGDKIYTINGFKNIKSINPIKSLNTVMYNIGIKGYNNYFANGINVYECSDNI